MPYDIRGYREAQNMANDSIQMTDDFDDENILNSEDETLYIQTGDEYDQILGRAQMTVVEGHDMNTAVRICGPSGCGKTTLARSLSLDIKIADYLINTVGIPVWKMDLEKLTLFYDIISNTDKDFSGEKTATGTEVCPKCSSKGFYERSTKTPTYRCQNPDCTHEFDEPKLIAENSSETEVEFDFEDEFEQLENGLNVKEELQVRGYIDSDGEKTDKFPHSRATVYRDLHDLFTDAASFKGVPYYEITMSHAKYGKDLIGHPHISDGDTTFIKGKFTQAIESSSEQATVLTLDEVNRAATSAKDELYDGLDGRIKVSIDEEGGIEITGDVSNLIIVSTMNKGAGHHVEPLDFAEKRRLGATYDVDFLGKEYPKEEIKLVENLTDVPHNLAVSLVETANEIRETAIDESTSLSYGVPTGVVIEWANQSYTNNLIGLDEPVVTAGESTVARCVYDHNDVEISEVESIISKNLGSIDFFSEDEEESTLSETKYVCHDTEDKGCTWTAFESDVEKLRQKDKDQVKHYLSCPECNSAIEEIKPGSR